MGVIAGHDRHGGRLWHRRLHRSSHLLRVYQERVVKCAVDLGPSLCKIGVTSSIVRNVRLYIRLGVADRYVRW